MHKTRSRIMRFAVNSSVKSLLLLLRVFALCFLVFLLLGIANAASVSLPILTKLAKEGDVNCNPALRYFCANIHVGCSGRTSIPTFPFSILLINKQVQIKAAMNSPEIRDLFKDKYNIYWAQNSDYILIHFHARRGYIKVLENGKYRFRYYRNGFAVMSYGWCD